MVFPAAAVAVGVGAIGAASQWMNSRQAAEAADDERRAMARVIENLKNPNFDPRSFTSEEYSVAAKYVPELASYIEEQAPQTVKASAAGEAGREAQLAALGRLKTLSETGEDLQSQVMRQRALGEAAQQNRGQQATIQQNAAQRGVGGSGLEFMQAMMAQQGSAQNASRAAQDAALEAYQNRLSAMKDSANLGGQIRGQDISEQAKNADIINDYNQRKTAEANRYRQYIAGLNNQANLYNIGNEQRVADANVGVRNSDAGRAQDRKDMIENARYTADMNKANLKIGQGARNIEGINQNAAARSAAIGGIQQAIGSGINAYQAHDSADKSYQLQKKKYDYLYGSNPQVKNSRVDENDEWNIA